MIFSFLLTASACWLGVVTFIALRHAASLFLPRRGQLHRLLGLFALLIYGAGLFDLFLPFLPSRPAYDVGLGLLGAGLASSALAFGHARVHKLQQSGTLDEHSTVSRSEMIEHVFFQLVNAAQLLYLHVVTAADWSIAVRLAMCWIASFIWLVRDWFPPNSFSANYDDNTAEPRSSPWIRFLYRAKKWQFVLFKHVLLFGLNVSVALQPASQLCSLSAFRIYFLLVAMSFVFEFFLQSLVKKHLLSQDNMLSLQHVMMVLASLASVEVVFSHVNLALAALSTALNFVNRKHDVFNHALVILAAAATTYI